MRISSVFDDGCSSSSTRTLPGAEPSGQKLVMEICRDTPAAATSGEISRLTIGGGSARAAAVRSGADREPSTAAVQPCIICLA